MPARQLPVRPDVDHVKHEAKHLLRAFRAGDSPALADFREFSSTELDAATASLSDAQLVLARSYGATSFPQLIAAVEFIRACWSSDGNRVREAVLEHAEVLKNYFKTPHDGWRGDLSAAARQGLATALKFMRESGALIADAQQRQEHAREWGVILPTLSTLGNPFARTPVQTSTQETPRSLAEVQERVRKLREKVTTPEEEAPRSTMKQRLKESAQDPTIINRDFERMRAYNLQFPAELEWMNECLRLYIRSHPLP